MTQEGRPSVMSKTQELVADMALLLEQSTGWLCSCVPSALAGVGAVWDQGRIRAVAGLAELHLSVRTLTPGPLRTVDKALVSTACSLVESQAWEDLVVCNQGLTPYYVTIARLVHARVGTSAGGEALRKVAGGRYLGRVEWPPRVMLSLALGLEELGIPHPFGSVSVRSLWAETLFGRYAPAWQWGPDDTTSFMTLVLSLASGQGAGLARLSTREMQYLRKTAHTVAVGFTVQRQADQAALALLCCALLDVPLDRGLTSTWQLLRGSGVLRSGALEPTGEQPAATCNGTVRLLEGARFTAAAALAAAKGLASIRSPSM